MPTETDETQIVILEIQPVDDENETYLPVEDEAILDAVYGLFNPIALYRFQVDASKCTHCGACQAACKLDIPVWKTPNSTQCIRCGACLKACRFGALRSTFSLKKPDSSFPEKETR